MVCRGGARGARGDAAPHRALPRCHGGEGPVRGLPAYIRGGGLVTFLGPASLYSMMVPMAPSVMSVAISTSSLTEAFKSPSTYAVASSMTPPTENRDAAASAGGSSLMP